MSRRNALYAQSGGVTAVINASACGVIETARKHKDVIGRVFGANNGILGALTEELIDTGRESARAIAGLRSTPSGAFGSCRYKLKSLEENKREYHRLIEVFRAHDIGYFFYNGGGDSQDTAHKVSQLGKRLGYPIQCVGIPKTVDNDLPFTDTCPGFGSVAKYVAVSVREAAMDVASMCETSTKVFIMEVMGRHAGWIAAASGLAAERPDDAPHVIVFPEVPFSKARFLKKVKNTVDTRGFCVIVVSEGARYTNGRFLADAGKLDAFGHVQLGGVAPTIAAMINDKHGYKYHWAVADYLQRAARHIASKTDVDQAYAVGKAAVEHAVRGRDGIMVTIRRTSDLPYRWTVGEAPLHRVANVERRMPKSYISRDGFGITARARRYLAPLIRGEDYPKYKQGLPQYTRLKAQLIAKKLPTFAVEA
ncbi:MAG TPA: diphosphate--fructose-6-phosphate 1-phosphotransferase [Gammaproteobacteria bacterium]|nr:diphosphate--fructose-6-phosphate 1-phosphotransferase [Gammaproteobacteria bacterium]